MPGIRTSRTRHPMLSRSAEVRKASADSSVSTRKPNNVSRFLSERRSEASLPPMRIGDTPRSRLASADPYICRGSAARDYPPWGHSRRRPSTPLSALSRRLDHVGCPRESLDAPENLPKERRRQGALGQLEDEVAGMSDEAPAGLEQPLLEARQRPARNAKGSTNRRSRLPRL